jgi:hypothetical protein
VGDVRPIETPFGSAVTFAISRMAGALEKADNRAPTPPW